jgi:phage virion morphogenesis protein
MTGVTMELSRDDQAVLAVLTRLQQFDATAMFDEIGAHLVSSVQQRFKRGVDPDGNAWEPLSDATMYARIGGGKARKKDGSLKVGAMRKLANMAILVDRGHLRDSITYQAESDGVVVGSNQVYAAIHQLGGEAGRRSARVRIPARPYLGLSADDRDQVMDIIRRRVRQAVDA